MWLWRNVVTLAVVHLLLCAGPTYSDDFPTKPIRMIAPEAGGGGNFIARLIAQGISEPLGRQVVVDNRGILAPDLVSKASPDGYTLLFYGSTIMLLPFLRKNAPLDPRRDLSPITLAVSSPYLLVLHPSLPVRSVKALIGYAESNPGVLNYGSAGAGSSTHLAAALFKSMAKVNIVHVPYRANALAITDLIAGRLQLMFPPVATVTQHVKSGKLVGLAVTSAQESALLPGLPTIAASGLPGYESIQMYGILAPARTSPAIINRLNREIVRVLKIANVKEQLLNANVEAVGSSPEQFSATIKTEVSRLGKLIKEAGILEE